MMRIGFVTSVDGWGGSEMYLKSLMTSTLDMGHEPILFGIYGTRLYSEAAEAGVRCVGWRRSTWMSQGQGVEVSQGKSKAREAHRFRKCILRWSPPGVADLLRDCSKLAAFWHLFDHEPVDVMHVNMNEYCEVAGIACKLLGIPSLGMFCAFPGKSEGRLKACLTRWIPRIHTAVASKSRACMNAWQEYSNLPADKCQFIWNGVDLDRFRYKEREPRAPDRPFRLLAVGRLDPMKGLDVLLRQWAYCGTRMLSCLLPVMGEEKTGKVWKSWQQI